MVNPQLRSYIETNLRNGFTKEALVKVLSESGWEARLIEEAFNDFVPQQPQVSPSIPPSVSPEERNMDILTNVTPNKSVDIPPLSKSIMQNGDDPRVLQHEPREETKVGNTTEPYFHGGDGNIQSKKGLKIALIVILACLFVGGGTAMGYFMFLKESLTTAEVIHNTQVAMNEKVDNVQFDYTMDFSLNAKQQKDVTKESEYFPLDVENMQFEIGVKNHGTGTVYGIRTEDQPRMDTHNVVGAKVGLAGFSSTFDIDLNSRSIGETVYLRLNRIPQILQLINAEKYVAPFVGQWVSISLSATSSLKTILSKDEMDEGEKLMESMTFTQDERKKLHMIFIENWPFILTPTAQGDNKNEDIFYRYRYAIDKEKFKAILTKTQDVYTKKNPDLEEVSLDAGELETVSQLFSRASGEMHIGKKDFFLYKMTLVLPLSYATSSIAFDGTLDFQLQLADYNNVKAIVAPDSSLPIQDIINKITLENKTKSGNARRISDIGQIQLALELYYDIHQKYPKTLHALEKEGMLPRVPVDPTTNKVYKYELLSSGKSYHVGASLEQRGAVLESDADGRSTFNNAKGTFGADDVGCDKEIGLYCYDVMP